MATNAPKPTTVQGDKAMPKGVAKSATSHGLLEKPTAPQSERPKLFPTAVRVQKGVKSYGIFRVLPISESQDGLDLLLMVGWFSHHFDV